MSVGKPRSWSGHDALCWAAAATLPPCPACADVLGAPALRTLRASSFALLLVLIKLVCKLPSLRNHFLRE